MKTHRYLAAGALALGVLVSASACATGGYYNQTGTSRVDYRELDRWAYGNGVRDGQQAGERDARARLSYRVQRDREYQKADNGFYHRGNYPLYQYQEMFRQGFEDGYSEAYSRSARSNNGRGRVTPGSSGPWYGGGSTGGTYSRSSASSNGFNDGLEAGRDDVRSNRSFEPRRPKEYREGDRGYSSADGSRDDYKREYRAAFQQGYEQGFREYRP